MQAPVFIRYRWTFRFLGVGLLLLLLTCVTRGAEYNTDTTYNSTTNYVVGNIFVPTSGTGTNNSYQVINGALVTNSGNWSIGAGVGATNNWAIVSGTGSVLQVGSLLQVGRDGSYNWLTITNGGVVTIKTTSTALASVIGNSASGFGNKLFVDGGGSALYVTNSGTYFYVGTGSAGEFTSNLLAVANGGQFNAYNVRVGHAASGNQFTINSGGQLNAAGALYVGYSGHTNTFTVSGSNSYARAAAEFDVGYSGHDNQARIENGARLDSPYGLIGLNAAGSNNTLTITGPGSVMSNWTKTVVGYTAPFAKLVISNGGRVESSATSTYVGDGSFGTTYSNRAEVTDAGSVWNAAALYVGNFSRDNTLAISNGGNVVSAGNVYVGYANAGSSNNNVTVTGAGALLKAGGYLTVGANGTSLGSNSFLIISDGGTVECNDIRSPTVAAGGSISNNGGIFQFTIPDPSVLGIVTLSNGTISYRSVSNANVFADVSPGGNKLTNITFAGNNAFRLHASSNTATAAQNYTFGTGLGATNYSRFEMINGNTLWRSGRMTIGSGGSMLASNTIGTVSAVVTNIGTIEVVNSKMTWSSNVVISGRYVSDPSTNTFAGDVTLTSSGSIAGGVGDLFDFKKSFLIQNSSNPTGAFNLASSTVSFSGGAPGANVIHTNAITGVDLGNNGTNGYPDGFTIQNFSYGKLTLGSTNDLLQFTSGNSAASNALYVSSLDLSGFTGFYPSVSNMLTSLLFAPTNINIYYFATSADDSYLNGLTYRLSASPGGALGGFLMPAIPEPSALTLLMLAGLTAIFRRR